jgi:short-subunit dehydrogenase
MLDRIGTALVTGSSVMALCPGATATGFQETAGVWEDQRESMPSADEVVKQALSAFEAGRPVCIHGAQNKLMAMMTRLGPPSLVARMAARIVGAQS